jgi:hypothetical protein
MAGPNSDTPAATRPSPTKIPPSAVTEVGCQWPSRRRRLASPRPIWNAKVGPSGRGERQPGMGTPESSMPSDAFRTGAHVTLAPVRIWHAETNDSEHRHEQSPVAVRMPPQPSRSSQSANERTLLSAVQSGSIRHGARSGGPIQTAPGSA